MRGLLAFLVLLPFCSDGFGKTWREITSDGEWGDRQSLHEVELFGK